MELSLEKMEKGLFFDFTLDGILMETQHDRKKF